MLLAVLIGALLLLPGSAAAATCRTVGMPPFERPDQDCTPGSYALLPQAEVCTPKDRPNLPAATRRYIIGRYGVPDWSGISGELDHRVPFFLGGRTNAGNVWPERGLSHGNPKDRLENYIRFRVCGSYTSYRPALATMRVGYARHIFLGNWVAYFLRYIQIAASSPLVHDHSI